MALHSTIKDTGAFFTIVPETREVKVPQTHKVIGVVGDHMAEQLTFEIPETIDGHDIGGCARRYVAWKNVDGELGTDQLVPLDESPEGAKEGMLYFTWTIRDRLAAVKGLVQFSLHFEDVAEGEDGESVLYHWGTTNCQNCEILDSINTVLSTYKAMYVAGDTLVIADYTPVADKALALEGSGLMPEGTLVITKNGTHDVGPYAQADVQVKTVSLDWSQVKINYSAGSSAPSGGASITVLSHEINSAGEMKVNTLRENTKADAISGVVVPKGSLIVITPATSGSMSIKGLSVTGGRWVGGINIDGSPLIIVAEITDQTATIVVGYK